MMQENDVKRPIQELEHDPIQKIETQPHDAPEKNEKANQALPSVPALVPVSYPPLRAPETE
ncbi:hypothetical protein C9F10_22460, partial [Salmonella enterica subsp. enterica serovar Poona]